MPPAAKGKYGFLPFCGDFAPVSTNYAKRAKYAADRAEEMFGQPAKHFAEYSVASRYARTALDAAVDAAGRHAHDSARAAASARRHDAAFRAAPTTGSDAREKAARAAAVSCEKAYYAMRAAQDAADAADHLYDCLHRCASSADRVAADAAAKAARERAK